MTVSMILYVAHPVAAPLPSAILDNCHNTVEWIRWLEAHHPDVVFCCPWLGPVMANPDGDYDPAKRERGLRDNCEVARLLDGIVLVGGRISSGMKRELDTVTAQGGSVYDLTSLGYSPPDMETFRKKFGGQTPISLGAGWWTASELDIE